MDFTNVLVPVDGSKADDEAVTLACRMTRRTKGKVWVVHVITVKRTLPLEAQLDPDIAKGEAILDHAESIADEQDCKIETDLLQSRDAGPTIIDEAAERQVDLIIMGADYRKRFGQYNLGSVALYVLKNAPCRVILYQMHQGAVLDSETQ